MRYTSFHKLIFCLLIPAFVYCWVTIPAHTQLFCVDQLVNESHAETWNIYFHPKRYIKYYYEHEWKLQLEDDLAKWTEFEKFQIPIPDSFLALGFFIHKSDFVAIFKNSVFQEIDRISGFWGRFTGSNKHVYIGLEKNGLKDAWDRSYTNLYIIAETPSGLEKFSGLDLRVATPVESDSILSRGAKFLYEHPETLRYIWRNADTAISFDRLKEGIRDSFNITVLVADFTADGVRDFVLKAKRRDIKVYRGEPFTMIFESGGKPPQFMCWSEFEQVIRGTDFYLLLIRTWQPETGMWGWVIYEGKGDGNLIPIFHEFDYAD